MPRERLPMRKIHGVLRLHAVGLSNRRIAVGLNIGRTAVGDYLRRARRAGLAWPLPEGLSDEALERLLFAPPPVLSPDRRPLPDWPLLHRELKRPGVTPVALVGGIPRRSSRRLRLQPVLRSLPGLARPARPDHAPDPCRRRQAVRRLRRRHGGRDRRPHRRGSHGPDLRRHPGRLPATPMPRRPGRRRCPIGSARTAAPSPISAGCPDRSYRTISNPASSRPACTIPRSTELTPAWRPITTPPSCRRGRANHATKRKWKSASRSSNAGSWPACEIAVSSASRN